MNNGLTIKREINLNTVVIVAGFLGTFGGIVASYSNIQADQRNIGTFIEEQKATNARFDERFQAQSVLLNSLPLMNAQVAQLKESQDNTEIRIGRVTESYSNQFSDIRSQLGSIGTQVALVKQSLDRIEAWRDADRPSRAPLR